MRNCVRPRAQRGELLDRARRSGCPARMSTGTPSAPRQRAHRAEHAPFARLRHDDALGLEALRPRCALRPRGCRRCPGRRACDNRRASRALAARPRSGAWRRTGRRSSSCGGARRSPPPSLPPSARRRARGSAPRRLEMPRVELVAENEDEVSAARAGHRLRLRAKAAAWISPKAHARPQRGAHLVSMRRQRQPQTRTRW